MQIVSFVSFKGGSGKTTTAIAIASTIIDQAMGSVFILDLDERQTSFMRWLEDTRRVFGKTAPGKDHLDGAAITPGQTVQATIGEAMDVLKAASELYDYCIIDTQGAQSPLALAICQISDLVIIPFQVTGVEIEPFVTSYKSAEKYLRVDNARTIGLTTRMPNIASSTMNATRDVLKKYNIIIENGTSQRDGYAQLVFETGTFNMIADKFDKLAAAADAAVDRKKAERESAKARAAQKDTFEMMKRIGLIESAKNRNTERIDAA